MTNRQDLESYRQTLLDLRQYYLDLRLEPPTEAVTIIPGTEGSGRPLGAKLPVYPSSECGTSDDGSGDKTLFNLKALTGFTPPSRPR